MTEQANPGPAMTPPKPSFWRRPDPLTQLVLTVPVFLIYHLGILFLDIRNGVDLASVVFWRLQSASIVAYVAVTLAFAAALLVAGMRMRKTHRVRPSALIPVLVESTVLAVGMMLLVGWVVQQVSASAAVNTMQAGGEAHSAFAKVVLSCGAGFHEELVFRVLIFGSLIWLAGLVSEKPWQRLAFAAVVSSVLFSGVHYVGSLADSFTFVSFFFRFLGGIYLAAVYRVRGFAVAVYTHTIYDILVMFFFG